MSEFNLKPGIQGQAISRVTDENTALKYGSGTVRVFATPAMIGLMEAAAINCVDSKLCQGYASVGTRVDIRHIAATPVGMSVTAKAELTEVDGAKLKFRIEAYDDVEKIGEGTHSRFVVNLDDFLSRAESKQQ
ncbi:MAG: thioesterase [Actinobacteria bacterium]|nr:thioesterase [Actinomycetota bacterium]